MSRAAARRELVSTTVMFGALLVVIALARRGVFASAPFFPFVFAGGIATFAALSLRIARAELFPQRVVLVIAVVAAAALLPMQHRKGVSAKVEAYEQQIREALVGKPAPALPFVAALRNQNFGREPFELEGKVSILNFWATWCAPCVTEMPELEAFWQENVDRGINVVGVTKLYDRTDMAAEVRAVEAFLDERDTNYPIIITDRRSPVFAAYKIGSLPSTILVGRDGKVVDIGAGINGTRRMLEKARTLAAN